MAKISTYPSADTPLLLSDRLIGTEAIRVPPSPIPLATKNFSLGELLNLFSVNFPAASLQEVLDMGNTATQDIYLTGRIESTVIKPVNIEDPSGSQGTTFQYLSKGTSSISWVNLPVDNLQAVLNSGNNATQNMTLVGNITSTLMIPGNIKDEASNLGSVGQMLTKTATGILWASPSAPYVPSLADVLYVGNVAINDINLTGNMYATTFVKSGGTSSQFLKADGSIDSSTYALASSLPTLTSDLTNDGDDGINPFISLADVPAQVNSDWNATSGVAEILNKPIIPAQYNPTAGTGISITGAYPNQTITNTAPDQVVALTAGTGIGVAGTYPNFTISNSDPTSGVTLSSAGGTESLVNDGTGPSLATKGLTAGTGISLSGTTTAVTVTNSAPDQTVALTAGTGIGVTGTYPNFTITNSSPSSGGTVTSVGLTMPSAFNVASSPVTTSGTLAVTGAGTVSQYVRGDGSLANFPSSTGGGSSVAFYLNGSVAQGTFGGIAFKEMDRTPIFGAGTDFTINANGYIQSFITDANVPNLLEIPAGNWNFETYFSASSGGGSPSFYVELYKWDGATLSLIASNSATPEGITNGTAIDAYFSALAVPQTTLLATDRLAIRIYVTHSGRTITLHTENSHLCEVITTFSTGLTALNGLTAQVQNFATGTSGTDFGISSATSTHTFNLPTASAINRGALSSADWTVFNSKVPSTRSLTINGTTQDLSADRTFSVGTVTSVGVTAGTGISVSGSPIISSGSITVTNSAPDQVVAIAAGTGIGVTGTYPNFTVTNSAPSSGGTVTSVSALTLGTTGTDLSSTVANGTTTPVITLNVPDASATNRGALTAANWTTFNGKQDALTLTTTGTSGAATLTGATLNIPQYSGGGGSFGIHALVPLSSGDVITASFIGSSTVNTAVITNSMRLNPFIPIRNITSASLSLDVVTAVALSEARILIYSDLNGQPDTKLYESANLNLSTIGFKTAITSFNFVAGTIYWLCVHSSGTSTIRGLNAAATLSIKSISTGAMILSYQKPQSFASSPTTLTGLTPSSSAPYLIFITTA
jgi:hypothetical protein